MNNKYWYGENSIYCKSKLKYVSYIITGNTPSKKNSSYYENGILEWVKPDNIDDLFNLSTSKQKLSVEGIKQSRVVPESSTLVCGIGTIGKLAMNNKPVATNQQINSIIFTGLDKKYGFYLISSMVDELKRNSTKVVVPILNKSSMENLDIVIPEIGIQEIIVRFLDNKVKIIDDIIFKKQKQVTLLDEEKQSVLINVLTKGVDSSVEMQDTGIDWIGKIPVHWKLSKIKNIFDIKKRENSLKNPKVLSMTQRGIKEKNLNDNSGQHAESYSKYQKVYKNDFVMNGMDLLTGYIDTSSFDYGVTSPDYRVFSLKNTDSFTEYYLLYFQMCYKQKIFYGLGQGVSKMGRWRLQTKVFKNFPIMVPPIDEQKVIVRNITEEIQNIDLTKEKLGLQLLKLREYRKSLIYETVIGKISINEMKKYLREVEEGGN